MTERDLSPPPPPPRRQETLPVYLPSDSILPHRGQQPTGTYRPYDAATRGFSPYYPPPPVPIFMPYMAYGQQPVQQTPAPNPREPFDDIRKASRPRVRSSRRSREVRSVESFDVDERPSHYHSDSSSSDNESQEDLGLYKLSNEIDDDSDGDDKFTVVYSFTPSRSADGGFSGQGSKEAENSSLTEREEEPVIPKEDRFTKIFHIVNSCYSGEGFLNGPHTADLTIVNGNHIKQGSLYRWIHFTRNSMEFDDFSTEALRVPSLSDMDRESIRNLITQVRRRFIRRIQIPNGRAVQHMEPGCIQSVLPTSSTDQTITPRSLTWICLPYFTLEPYSGLLSADRPSAFPIQTLMQAKYSGATYQRDMQQAVCQTQEGAQNHCFHIAQLWCIILDNSLLLTYSRMPEDALCSEFITRNFLTSAQLATSGPKVNLSVRYRGNVMWSIPVEECQTWFDFISHFRDFWPCRLAFFWHKRQVTPEDWPKIMHLPHRINNRITLDLQLSNIVNAPKSRSLHPTEREKSEADKDKSNSAKLQSSHKESGTPTDQHRKSPPRNAQTPKESNQNTEVTKLSMLTRLDGVARPNNSIDEVTLEDHMEKVEDFLLHRTSFTDSRAYKACSSLLRIDVRSMLENEGKELLNSDTPSEKLKAHEDLIDIFNTVDSVFQFFLPMTSKTPTAMKFWGAVHRIVRGKLKSRSSDGNTETWDFEPLPSRFLKHVLDSLKPFAVGLIAWSDLLSHAKASDHTRIKAPDEFLQAWLHLLMGFIYLSKENHHRSDDFISSAQKLLNRGFKTMIQSLSKRNLLESSVVLPLELVSLMSLKLLQSITPGHPDITKTYSSYIDSIEADIVMKPSNRSHEKRLMQLKHEISIIRKIIDSQRSIFNKLKEHNSTKSSRSPNHRSDEPQIPAYDPTHTSRTRYLSRTTGAEDSRVHPSYRRDYYDTMKQEPAYIMDPPTNFKLKSTDAGGYRHLLLQECTMLIYSHDINFMDFDFQVSQAEGINRNKIDTTKDRQEQAIYAFTIVTIIFLPLSAVASIFGMNTNDVRNMDFGQWIYWAVAIPVTVVVICLGLLWTGELGNILQWILSFRADQRRFAYEPIRADEHIPRRAHNYEELYPLPQFEAPYRERIYTREYR